MKKNLHQGIKQPWPTKDAMEQIYEMKLWGTNYNKFYSGNGSHLREIVEPYLKSVSEFLVSFKEPLIVCDLGCGDFNIGKELVKYTKQYIAVDIVPALIQYNKERYSLENLEFQCSDIATDALPVADCAILRQVLQHLSNAEVQRIVSKLNNFKYIIITEHVPQGDVEWNRDIISGQGIRLKKQSGLNITAPPFSFKVKEEIQLNYHPLNNGKEALITTCYRTF